MTAVHAIARQPATNSPTCPALPAAWTASVSDAARAHTQQCYPNEAAGIVLEGQYVPLENRSPTPGQDVFLSDDDLLRVADAELFFHSHPDGLGCPSETDMVYQQQLGIPFVVMVWPFLDVFCWGDMLKPAPVIGRGFRHGVHDCYSLIRDWYFEAHGVRLLDQPRGWNWWLGRAPQNHYLDNFAQVGARQIPVDEANQRGDVILFNFSNAVPMHGAVVYDRDLMLHHISGIKPHDPTRLSGMVPRQRYHRFATFALRYQP